MTKERVEATMGLGFGGYDRAEGKECTYAVEVSEKRA